MMSIAWRASSGWGAIGGKYKGREVKEKKKKEGGKIDIQRNRPSNILKGS